MDSDDTSASRFVSAEILDRIKAQLGLKSDQALGARYGYSRNLVAQWRKRDTVPLGLVAQAALVDNLSLDWILLGRGEPVFTAAKPLDEPLLETVIVALDRSLGIANVELPPERFARLVMLLYEQNLAVDPRNEMLENQARRLLKVVS